MSAWPNRTLGKIRWRQDFLASIPLGTAEVSLARPMDAFSATSVSITSASVSWERQTAMNLTKAVSEIRDQRRSVGFDSYDITVKQLVDMVSEKQIHISPEYQRRFVWDEVRQSQLIESIFLGIPIPSLFMATNEDSTWEVIDGLQRLTTMMNFVTDGESILRLKGMEKLPSLNGGTFEDLPSNLKLSFVTRPIRITVLNDRSDYQVRFDLFERLNTGGISLHEQEIRNCVF